MANKNYLLITLGHSSSAIFVDNTTEKPKIIGYEQERLSRIKADSQFPIDAINEIKHNVEPNKILGCTILISHWFNFVNNNIPNKYITENDLLWLHQISKDIKFVSPEFTHHDAHAYSAYTFFKYSCHPNLISHIPVHCIVADGFGNDEEVLSIYSVDLHDTNAKPKCIHRTYGYYFSLGLFYQYATSFVGMKENQDEYKFLGYEAHIDEEFSNNEIIILNSYIKGLVSFFTENILLDVNSKKSSLPENEVINFEELSRVKEYWHSKFTDILDKLNLFEHTTFKARCAIAYIIQQTVEKVFSNIAKEFGIVNLCVAGGCFFNVKLNNKLFSEIKGLFSVMPLAGDQGAAIGMYAAEEGLNQFPFDTLAWGKRRLYNFQKIAKGRDNVIYINIKNDHDFIITAERIAEYIANGHIVDLIFGNMEFGPRALCNTSTLFLPTSSNTENNNRMNERNEVMPCAPVCTYENAIKLFGPDIERVVGSDRFMICTHDYKRNYSKQYGGVMHKKTLEDAYTGRPQIVRNGSFSYAILKKVEELTDIKCLVNTSFNVHGCPIVFDTMDILQNHAFQMAHADSNHKPVLFVIEFGL